MPDGVACKHDYFVKLNPDFESLSEGKLATYSAGDWMFLICPACGEVLYVEPGETEGDVKPPWKPPPRRNQQCLYEVVQRLYPTHKVFLNHRPFGFVFANGRPMQFDVFVPSLNLALEYQGQQHFEPIEVFGGERKFKRRVECDGEKRELCKKRGIRLVEIDYRWDGNAAGIETKIREALQS
jgi:hypothetical protein